MEHTSSTFQVPSDYSPCNDEAYALEFSSAEEVQALVSRVDTYFRGHFTLGVEFRIRQLKALRSWLKSHEVEVLQALTDDLGKAPFEGYATELGIVYDEIRTCLANVRKWSSPKGANSLSASVVHFPSTSKVYASPMGTIGIMSPWNYPLQLALVPLVDAICAGNCVVLKPSQTSPHTSDLLRKMCQEAFDSRHVFCLPAGGAMNDWILECKFDKIFFTGSPNIGKKIMHAAADTLTPVTLELGGKSPCFIDKTANIKRAAQRIAWGKCINSGQTCVAPDYFLVHEDVVDEFINQMKVYLHKYYGADILKSEEYPHIVNKRHFDRVCGLIDNHGPNARVALGGGRDPETLKIEPTIMTGVSLDDPVMKEEIFGPVMPILTWNDATRKTLLDIPRKFGHPLACYVFSEDKAFQKQVIDWVPFGGATINDVVIHLANNKMGFGGFGNSGMGAYHGKVGFDCFTHYKSTLTKGNLIELPVRVPPFGNKIALLRLLMR